MKHKENGGFKSPEPSHGDPLILHFDVDDIRPPRTPKKSSSAYHHDRSTWTGCDLTNGVEEKSPKRRRTLEDDEGKNYLYS